MGGGWCWYFLSKTKNLLCIVDNYGKFSIVKKADSLAADELVKAANSESYNIILSPLEQCQMEACITFVKHIIKNVNLALLQI